LTHWPSSLLQEGSSLTRSSSFSWFSCL
jgi:hypothetical protein